jgi:hypothetical protein
MSLRNCRQVPRTDLSTCFFFFSISYFYFVEKKLLYRNGLGMVTNTNRGTTRTNRGSKNTNRGSKNTNRGSAHLIKPQVFFIVLEWPSSPPSMQSR